MTFDDESNNQGEDSRFSHASLSNQIARLSLRQETTVTI